MPRRDPIKHVVVLMFENHSFDQMLGCYKAVYPDLEGVNAAHVNTDSTGRVYPQTESRDLVVSPDPKHELANVRNQLDNGNSGFVRDYESSYPTTVAERARIMGYYPRGLLPALHGLADHFMICDHWYSSVPGPTWTNRFFVHSGTSKGFVTMPEGLSDAGHFLRYDQDTIFDRLTARRVSWCVYFGDVPQSLVLRHQMRPRNARNYRLMHSYFADAGGPERRFPTYAFIEPNYFKGEQNDDHPPHSAVRAQRLLGRVYNALRANTDLWKSTLLVVLYDEHGGFYDHVAPPAAVPPDAHTDEFSFDRLGVRVPSLLISPWVERGFDSTTFDHASPLRYLIDKWRLDPLTERVRAANSFAGLLANSRQPRDDTPEEVPVPPRVLALQALPPGAPPDATPEELDEPLNDYQRSLLAFTEYLEQEQPTKAMVMAGPMAESELAERRVRSFLAERGARL